jgi:hypothetical protein
MEEIKAPKKERKFLKAVGNIAKVLANELVMGIARKFIGKAIDKVGNKRQGLMIAFIILASSVAFAQYPSTGNKQRLGYQTSGDGLTFRGRASDTTALKPSTINNAYHLFDTVNNVLFSYIKTKGGWKFNNSDTVIINGVTMPFDSITFNTAKDGTVGVGELEYNDTQGSLIQGLKGGLVTNVIGQQLHQRVNNRTGATLTKGTAVYLSGSQGNRITVAKAIATSDPTSANTFGIVAESIADNQSGYVITEGLITNINTSALTQDSAVYLSGTTAGALTSTKPQAPIHGVYIGVCVKTNAGSGEVFVKIRNGQELDELHDVQISSPVDKASLYYTGGLWRDTTAALLVSDTASMLTPYFRDVDTTSLNLVSRFATKLNISDTSAMLTNYLRTGVAAATYQTKLTNPITGTGTTNYLPKFTGTSTLGNSSIYDNGNIGIGNNNPTVAIDLLNSTSSTSAKIRLSTEFASAVRTLELSSGDGLSWDLPPPTSQSPYIKVVGGDQSVGGGGLNLMTDDISRLFIRKNGAIGIGTITPDAKFEVHGSAVFNEGSTDSDFRVESDGNANMVFVDASTDRVGIGTNAPDKTLHVNGEVKIATVTATPTALLGKDGSNVVGELGLGTGMSVGSGILSVQAAGASATGLVTSFGSQTFGGNKTFNGNVNISTGTLDVGSTGTFGGRVKTNWLERNYSYSTSSSFTVSVNTTWQDINTNVLTTLTLPNPATYPGKELHLRQTGTGNLQSDSSNIIPFNTPPTGSTSTGILTASLYEAVTLVSDGTNWIIMQRSEN